MKKILCISDLHCGSLNGLIPYNFTDDINNELFILNDVQRYLFQQWIHMCNTIRNIDYCIVCGDLVDGANYGEKGKGQITTDIYTQAKMACHLLKMIDTKNFVIVDGSGYHVGQEISGDMLVADMLNGHFGNPDIELTCESITFHIRHHEQWSRDPGGRHTAARKEANVSVLQNEKIDVFIRGHIHSFNYNGDKRNMTVILPAWKGPDKFQRKKYMEIPDNGYVVFTVNNNIYNWEQTIFNIPKELFRKQIII
ncbi:MAG TPA: hypothetical protein PK024_08495 [Methanospirillum sp.]|uniref:hypothetical protein n=1 Tax=Methanospirillum sp. TaxID=45200 RepID=UPI002BC061D1|nr:hypothetical protein [Methanospirillum sp.]HOJ96856.1 hypothetical protein [Methanospirillum sp.]